MRVTAAACWSGDNRKLTKLPVWMGGPVGFAVLIELPKPCFPLVVARRSPARQSLATGEYGARRVNSIQRLNSQ